MITTARPATSQLPPAAEAAPQAASPAPAAQAAASAGEHRPPQCVGRLLVIDDTAGIRDLLQSWLSHHQYHVTLAASGAEGLEILDHEAFDLLLLDVMMPGLSGPEVLGKLRQRFSQTQLPVIMATAVHQSKEMVRALELGANDYVTKPFDFPVLIARIRNHLALKRAHDRIGELQGDLQRQNVQLSHANKTIAADHERLSRDLGAAAELQAALLPKRPPEDSHASFAWMYRPCDKLGGDFVNVFRLDEEHLGLYCLDVSGHGLKAALLSATLSRLLSPAPGRFALLKQMIAEGQSYRLTPPHEVAAELNRRFPLDLEVPQYFTMIYGLYHSPSRTLRYVSAGHPGLVLARLGQEAQVLQEPGFPVGWIEDAEYETVTVNLQQGDRIYLYSDGIVEAMDQTSQAFGKDRLCSQVDQARPRGLQDGLEELLATVIQWSGGSPIDDVSALAMEVR